MIDLKKILVIGGGIAGPTVCYWLKRFGFSPTLIEKHANIRKTGQGLDIRGAAVSIVKKMGIYEEIGNMRTQMECCRYVDTKDNLLHQEHGEKSAFRQEDDVEIIRSDLVKILMKLITDIPYYSNQVVESIEQNEDSVRVNFHDGRVEQYDLILGADGIHSATRNMVFDKDEYKLIDFGLYFSIFTIPNYLNLHRTELVCEANQKLVTLTNHVDPNTITAAFAFRSQHVLQNVHDEKEQKQLLRNIFHDFCWEVPKIFDLLPNSDDFYFDVVTQVKMNSWTKGRIALLGDAGYSPSPLSGQGTNLALIGAYVLAGELKSANGNYTRAFDRYNKLLRTFVDANQKLDVFVSEAYLVADEVSKEIAEERANKLLKMASEISKGITLHEYERN